MFNEALYQELLNLIHNNNLGTIIVSANIGAQMKNYFDFTELSSLEKESLLNFSGEFIIGKFMDHLVVVCDSIQLNDFHIYKYGDTEETCRDLYPVIKLLNVEEF